MPVLVHSATTQMCNDTTMRKTLYQYQWANTNPIRDDNTVMFSSTALLPGCRHQ